MQNRKIKMVSYNPIWPEFFKQEAERLQLALNDHLKEIHHIGSTAIPNMSAKPIIDILLECDSLDNIDSIERVLKRFHFESLRRSIIPHRSFFSFRQDKHIRFHLHLYEMGDPQVKRHVNFRDYLIHHPDVANIYANLKEKLAQQFTDNIFQYVAGKDKLVQEIDAKAKVWSGRRKNYLVPHTGLEANKWSREKMIKAMEANLNVHMTHFSQYINQIDLMRVPGFTLVNSNLLEDAFNYVIDADFTATVASQKISEITDYFKQRKQPFSWWISPHDNPVGLAERLEMAGYLNTENNIAMYFDLDSWDSEGISVPELKIMRATDKKSLSDYALILTHDQTAFETYYAWVADVITEDDPIEYYVGYIDGIPVVRGLSCYYAGVVGLHGLSTTPEARHKGYGMAMQQFRLQRAKELGYHIAVLQASTEGFPLYQRLGYKECGIFQKYKLMQDSK